MNSCGRGLVESEEQDENKKMKLIVVEEQEQEEGSESESESRTGFVDLDPDTLLNVLKRVDADAVTLGRAACVNKLWREVALDERLWEPIVKRILINMFPLNPSDKFEHLIDEKGFRYLFHSFYKFLRKSSLPQNLDFYSIDFSKKIRPWR